jgi:hypothetical protein
MPPQLSGKGPAVRPDQENDVIYCKINELVESALNAKFAIATI